MITDLESLLYKAENSYLQQSDINIFKSQIFSLEKRVEIYESLRTQELEIFQYIANRLTNKFAETEEAKLKKALKHWIAILQHCAIAMVVENNEYLQLRILNILPRQIEAFELIEVEQSIYELLIKRLQKNLGSDDFSVLQPFLEQVKEALFGSAI